MNNWTQCKKILCIRPDNMGDLIMSGPAICALKESFGAHITVLTSSIAAGIAKLMPEIDEIMIFDLPWVKTAGKTDQQTVYDAVELIKQQNFDAAVIFTVFSQNPLPTAMLAYLAGIPRILAYCRENPYGLLTDWVPDKEPYKLIKHQVRRDLDLVAAICAYSKKDSLYLAVNETLWPVVEAKLVSNGIDPMKPWLILHAGVSEKKRQYPKALWIETAKKLTGDGYQVLFSGSDAEKKLTGSLANGTGPGGCSIGGLFNLEEFVTLIAKAPVVVAVNTGAVHIAAAVGTPVVVLYAETNPQHTPWNVPCKVLPFPVPTALQSKNQVLTYLNETIYQASAAMPGSDDIISAIEELLTWSSVPPPAAVLNQNQAFQAN